jgi:hypothetical protein
MQLMLPQKNDDINFEYNHVTYKTQGKLNQIVQSKKHSQNHMTQLPYSINIQNTSARVPLKIITDGNQYENNNRFIIILMTMCYSGHQVDLISIWKERTQMSSYPQQFKEHYKHS